MPTTLLFIRHGLTDWNAEKRWQGHADIPLNETGHAQANALARRLADWPIERIISSDLQRCAQTAQAIVTHHPHIELAYDPIWRERDVGDFSGLTFREIREQFPEIWANSRRGMLNPPSGEPYEALRQRALTAYEQALAAHTGQTIAIITHGGILHTLIAQLIHIREDKYGRFSLRGNTGLNIIEVTDEGKPYLIRLNDTSHLENGFLTK
ncbi:MAG TPA: histidine phosphatase family protein [Anaerolineae bacterium]|nr:histidine phosphatase family protein [Anaerolineae bacterium]HIP73758.1 histidine phosphatase family protein [Anaerolineae bacterium]